MVAITVVLAATVYVWVSGFGGQSGSASRSMSLTSSGSQSATFEKAWTVASATPGLRYQDLTAQVGSTRFTFISTSCDPGENEWSACAGSSTRASTALVTAGDIIRIDASATQIGSTMIITDSSSNSVLAQIVVSN